MPGGRRGKEPDLSQNACRRSTFSVGSPQQEGPGLGIKGFMEGLLEQVS